MSIQITSHYSRTNCSKVQLFLLPKKEKKNHIYHINSLERMIEGFIHFV